MNRTVMKRGGGGEEKGQEGTGYSAVVLKELGAGRGS